MYTCMQNTAHEYMWCYNVLHVHMHTGVSLVNTSPPCIVMGPFRDIPTPDLLLCLDVLSWIISN